MRKKRTLLLFLLVISLSALYLFLVPDVARLKKHRPGKTAFMEYREKEWKSEGRNYRVRQKWIPLSRISPYLVKAVLSGEDDKFWRHEGFDYEAMQKAIEKDLKAGKFAAGGSTITQQLAKNLYLSPSKNPVRKIREAIIAWKMERVLSKGRILELYLNVAEWGDKGIFGIESAARHYYGVSASQLGPEQAVRLAAVLPNPRKYSPLSTSNYVVKRSNLIYRIMVRRGIIVPEVTEEEVVEAEEPAVGAIVEGPVPEAEAEGISANGSLQESPAETPAY